MTQLIGRSFVGYENDLYLYSFEDDSDDSNVWIKIGAANKEVDEVHS